VDAQFGTRRLGGPSVPAPTVLGHWSVPHQWINIVRGSHRVTGGGHRALHDLLGRVAGIPVGMPWSTLIGIALLGQLVGLTVLPSTAPGLSTGAYWLAGGLAALRLGGSLLTQELAHAVVARRAGRAYGGSRWVPERGCLHHRPADETEAGTAWQTESPARSTSKAADAITHPFTLTTTLTRVR
jgi:hypothetical protein